ncbi:MAG: SsrA-binding protein, partial [Rikenellaceae bacterium]|nr:SsrA-binding protein [Rikenellaceae bacterium]
NGLTVVGIRLFTTGSGLPKLDIGVGRGRKKYDKRDYIKEKDAKRLMDRAMKSKL